MITSFSQLILNMKGNNRFTRVQSILCLRCCVVMVVVVEVLVGVMLECW